MSLSSDISTTSTALSDIKTAIIAKGVTPSGNITTYATAIANIQTEPTLASLTITPSTTAQTLTPPSGTDGYNTVNVSAVTASIDANITAGNIKKDVSILGVTGSYEGTSATLITKTITANGTYAASSDNADGYSSVTVNVSGGGGGGGTTYSYPELKGGNYYVFDDETVVPVYFDSCNVSHSTGDITCFGTLIEINNSIAFVKYNTNNQWSSSRPPFTSNIGITNGSFIDFHIKHISLNGFPSSNYLVQILNSALNDWVKDYLTSVCISGMKNLCLKQAFANCTYLSEVDVSMIDSMPNVYALGGTASVGGAFSRTAVQTLSFNSLNSNSFGSYTNQFNYMLRYQTNCTVHFPSNLQSVIGSWSSVTSGFGGTNTTVLFDLPATT